MWCIGIKFQLILFHCKIIKKVQMPLYKLLVYFLFLLPYALNLKILFVLGKTD